MGFRSSALTVGLVLAGAWLTPGPSRAAPSAASAAADCCGVISPAGDRLLSLLDGLQVETHWLAGDAIDWRTGNPKPGTRGLTSHCSAFAAAVAQRFGAYLLRPPEHGQVLLANAQAAWLAGDAGRAAGWSPLDGAVAAQSAANAGALVVISYRSANPRTPGHIAVVRPARQTLGEVTRSGPMITQAGQQNFNATRAETGFHAHRAAWPGGVAYYAFTPPR